MSEIQEQCVTFFFTTLQLEPELIFSGEIPMLKESFSARSDFGKFCQKSWTVAASQPEEVFSFTYGVARSPSITVVWLPAVP